MKPAYWVALALGAALAVLVCLWAYDWDLRCIYQQCPEVSR